MIATITKRISFILFILLACCMLPVALLAQQAVPHSIYLKSGTITASPNVDSWLAAAKGNIAKDPVQVLINFNTLPTAAQQARLKQAGITLLDYLPDNTYTAIISAQPGADVLPASSVYSIISSKPEWKADTYIWKKIAKEKGQVEVLVSFYGTVSADAIRQFIAAIGGRIDPGPMEQYGAYKVIIASGSVRDMAAWYGVHYISPVTAMVPLDLQSRASVKGNSAVAPPLYGGYNILGDSVTVGVGDNTSGIVHIDLRDRIVNFNPAKITHHGVFVNGVVGSAGIIDPFAEGQVPHVRLVNFLFDQIFPATGAMFRDYNMTITNNSYTVIEGDCDYAGTYDLYSRLLDTQAIQFPYVQHIFAAGNDGLLNCSPYINGFANVGGGYQPAKNNIVVGSTTYQLQQADDESRGPVKDGRLKPEMVAVGKNVYSAIDFTNYVSSSGTSFASPQVAGGMATLTQRYKQLHTGGQPRADLLKTILLNACTDLGNPGPDYSYGFGSMDIGRSLQLLDNGQYRTGDINTGDSQSFTITIPAGMAQAKVMLYWNDLPASPSSAVQLINDLDIVLRDPSTAIHLPLGLDPAPANVNDNAVEKEDHLNNTEQVTINSPAAGTYTVVVRGHSIPFGPQHYVVAYDLIPKPVQLTFPLGGEELSNADSLRIFWNDIPDGNAFSVELSQNNGATWTMLNAAVPAAMHYYSFLPTGINSGICLVRVHRNGTTETSMSQRFSITAQPVVQFAASQCPGYLNVHWSPVPGATTYQVMKKTGPYMQVIDTVADTTYSYSGLPLSVAAFVAVKPIVNGFPGYRSRGVYAIPNTGDCSNPVSAGDLLPEQIISPLSGRAFTSSAPGASTAVQVKIRNLYTSPAISYTLSYRVNAGPWQSLTTPTVIPANSTAVATIPGLDLSAPGNYTITVAVHNLAPADPQPGNDTLAVTIKNLPNAPIDLTTPFTDGFEDANVTATHDSIGITPNAHWDYFNDNDTGRLRSFVYDSIAITGNRSISMDEIQCVTVGSRNTFVGTFNMGAYDTAATEVRLDFDYILHGTPRSADGNMVTARGADNEAWSPVYSYDLNAYAGFVTPVRSLSFTDAVRLAGHNFSTSTQVSFGQNDTSLIGARNFGNGLTLDNFRLYTVANDAMITKVVSPLPGNCGLPAIVPLTVQVHNGVNYTLHNVQLFYRLDSGIVYTGLLDSIRAKDTINYTFAQQLDISRGAAHTLDVWLSAPGDTYALNDSILSYHFRNSNIITGFPYLENFEAGDGGYYPGGFNSSWQYGTPASARINKAASGVKAWKTDLTGRYNSLERSYLYSPCFDIAQLTSPMLSFSTAMDLENCGNILCDGAWAEYSFDGVQWTKLGAAGQGTNWYDSTFNIWNTNGFTRWHVATIALPQPPAGATLHLRFVLAADPAVNFEGLAVDDIHIYDLVHPIYSGANTASLTQDAISGGWTDYLYANSLLASLQPRSQSIGSAKVTLYRHDTLSNPSATQYAFPRSYSISAAQLPADSAAIRLYLPDTDVVRVVSDTTCPSCTGVQDAYSLGITQYTNANNHLAENGTLTDDTGGIFTYYPYRSITWVPYDKGYYAQLTAQPLSELWFNNGGPTGTFSIGTDYLNFLAFKSGTDVTTYWYSLIDTAVNAYTLQRSADGVKFDSVTTITAVHKDPADYMYTDPVGFTAGSVLYYRLSWQLATGSGTYYSPIRRVGDADSAAALVTFAAAMAGSDRVLAAWTSFIDGLADHYILERATGNGAYTVINTVGALRHYAQRYSFTDVPAGVRPGTLLHYRLTAVLANGTQIVLPEQAVLWIDGSSVADIYPNPTADGTFTIHWLADPGSVMQVQLTDALGRSMDNGSFTASGWDNVTVVHTTRRAKGVYFVKIQIGGTRFTARVVYD